MCKDVGKGMALLWSETGDGHIEDWSQRVMRASAARGMVRSVEGVASGGCKLKWVGDGLGFVGMSGQSDSRGLCGCVQPMQKQSTAQKIAGNGFDAMSSIMYKSTKYSRFPYLGHTKCNEKNPR